MVGNSRCARQAKNAFADALVRFGQFAERAARRAGEITDEAERIRVLTSNVKGLARFFWFTVEFGLIREDGKVKVYGSGLVSSHAESAYSLTGEWEKKGREVSGCAARPVPVYRPFDLERVCETDFEIDHYQPVYYVLESFEQLRDAMNKYAERVIGEAGLAKAAGR